MRCETWSRKHKWKVIRRSNCVSLKEEELEGGKWINRSCRRERCILSEGRGVSTTGQVWEAERHPISVNHGAKGTQDDRGKSLFYKFRLTIAANTAVRGISAATTVWVIEKFLWICIFPRAFFVVSKSVDLRKIRSHSHTNIIYTSFGAKHYSCTLSKGYSPIPMNRHQLLFLGTKDVALKYNKL